MLAPVFRWKLPAVYVRWQTEWEAADALVYSYSEARAKAKEFLKTMAEFIIIVDKHNLL